MSTKSKDAQPNSVLNYSRIFDLKYLDNASTKCYEIGRRIENHSSLKVRGVSHLLIEISTSINKAFELLTEGLTDKEIAVIKEETERSLSKKDEI